MRKWIFLFGGVAAFYFLFFLAFPMNLFSADTSASWIENNSKETVTTLRACSQESGCEDIILKAGESLGLSANITHLQILGERGGVRIHRAEGAPNLITSVGGNLFQLQRNSDVSFSLRGPGTVELAVHGTEPIRAVSADRSLLELNAGANAIIETRQTGGPIGISTGVQEAISRVLGREEAPREERGIEVRIEMIAGTANVMSLAGESTLLHGGMLTQSTNVNQATASDIQSANTLILNANLPTAQPAAQAVAQAMAQMFFEAGALGDASFFGMSLNPIQGEGTPQDMQQQEQFFQALTEAVGAGRETPAAGTTVGAGLVPAHGEVESAAVGAGLVPAGGEAPAAAAEGAAKTPTGGPEGGAVSPAVSPAGTAAVATPIIHLAQVAGGAQGTVTGAAAAAAAAQAIISGVEGGAVPTTLTQPSPPGAIATGVTEPGKVSAPAMQQPAASGQAPGAPGGEEPGTAPTGPDIGGPGRPETPSPSGAAAWLLGQPPGVQPPPGPPLGGAGPDRAGGGLKEIAPQEETVKQRAERERQEREDALKEQRRADWQAAQQQQQDQAAAVLSQQDATGDAPSVVSTIPCPTGWQLQALSDGTTQYIDGDGGVHTNSQDYIDAGGSRDAVAQISGIAGSYATSAGAGPAAQAGQAQMVQQATSVTQGQPATQIASSASALGGAAGVLLGVEGSSYGVAGATGAVAGAPGAAGVTGATPAGAATVTGPTAEQLRQWRIERVQEERDRQAEERRERQEMRQADREGEQQMARNDAELQQLEQLREAQTRAAERLLRNMERQNEAVERAERLGQTGAHVDEMRAALLQMTINANNLGQSREEIDRQSEQLRADQERLRQEHEAREQGAREDAERREAERESARQDQERDRQRERELRQEAREQRRAEEQEAERAERPDAITPTATVTSPSPRFEVQWVDSGGTEELGSAYITQWLIDHQDAPSEPALSLRVSYIYPVENEFRFRGPPRTAKDAVTEVKDNIEKGTTTDKVLLLATTTAAATFQTVDSALTTTPTAAAVAFSTTPSTTGPQAAAAPATANTFNMSSTPALDYSIDSAPRTGGASAITAGAAAAAAPTATVTLGTFTVAAAFTGTVTSTTTAASLPGAFSGSTVGTATHGNPLHDHIIVFDVGGPGAAITAPHFHHGGSTGPGYAIVQDAVDEVTAIG